MDVASPPTRTMPYICLNGGNVKWGHDQLRDACAELSRTAWGNCVREPVAREALQRAKDRESDRLVADFSVRGVWKQNRACPNEIMWTNQRNK
jgi:hypothetical protein